MNGADAELVAAVLAGDRAGFAALYDRYADRLHDFCWSLLRDPDEAADATQDTFLIAAERLGQLRDPERVRPWLYAIARSQALRRLRARRRIDREAEVTDYATADAGPERAAEQAELRTLVWDAAAGLADRDRALLDLHLRQGLEGAELGAAMGVSAGHAAVLLHRLRGQVERSLGALLVARLGSDDCDDLRALLAGWDGRFSPLLRKRVARHVDDCAVCDERRQRMVSPWALLSTVPMVGAPPSLRPRVLEQVRLTGHGGSGNGRGRTAVAAAVIAVAVAGAAFFFALARQAAPPTAPSEASAAPTVAAVAPTEVPVTEPAVVAPAPAVLTISSGTLDLGAEASGAGLAVGNDGGLPLTWSATPTAGWLSVEPAGGTIAAGQRADLAVSVDRSALPEGDASAALEFTSDAGDATVQVLLTQERPPVIGPLTFSPATIGCAETSLAGVTISDEAGVASATASWDGGSTRLTLRAGSWYGRVGPAGADLTVTVEAVDARGNRATGDPAVVQVQPCSVSS